MKKTLGLILVAAAFSLTTGCAAAMNRSPVTGLLFSDVKAGENISSNNGAAKTGEACATSILGLVATGDASIEAAAKNGGITKISYVDGYNNNILGVVAKYCTVAHGE